MTATEDAPIPTICKSALLDLGMLTHVDVAEHLGEIRERQEATKALQEIKGIGKSGATRIVTWLRDQGWPEPDRAEELAELGRMTDEDNRQFAEMEVADRRPTDPPVLLSPDEHPDVTIWRAELARRFPSTDIARGFDLAKPIFAAYEEGRIPAITIHLRASKEKPRTYLGASGIGQECSRKAWAQWRGLGEQFEGRLLRLFRSGDVYEDRMRAELEAIGFQTSGQQAGFSAFGGRVKGHVDDFVTLLAQNESHDDELPWALWEAKSAKHSRYTRLFKLRRDQPATALKTWDLKYWYQVQTYMAAFGLHVCLYEVTDKDTDHIIAFLVPRDDEAVREAGGKAELILGSVGPPPRGYGRAKTPECTRFCDQVEWCWHGAPLPKTCGSCSSWHDSTCARDGLPALALCEEYSPVLHSDEKITDEWEDL